MLPSLPCDSLWTPEALVEFSYLPNPKRSGVSRTPEAPVKFPMALPNAPALRNSWLNTFVTSTHDATLGSFETYLSNTSVNLRLIVAGTEPSVAFLVAHPGRQVKLVHHRHHDNGTPLSPGALYGHDILATPVLIPRTDGRRRGAHVDAVLMFLS